MKNYIILSVSAAALFFVGGTYAQSSILESSMDHDMDHGQHNMHKQKKSESPLLKHTVKKLKQVPASGESREAGFDSSHVMEHSDVNDQLARKCAQASRGIIILDNKSWESCGGKPKGVASAKLDKKAASGHDGHAQHN